MTRAEFATEYNVSRETMDRFDTYIAALQSAQSRMNLVAPSTLGEIWLRHIADSAQIRKLARPLGSWLDIGAGAGFPGLVLALLGETSIHLVEATLKKCVFLQDVIGKIEVTEQVVVHRARVESMPAFRVDTITARACASLVQLFDWGLRFADDETSWLLPKGANVDVELNEARHRFVFESELVQSRTHAQGRIVVARDVRRR